MRDSPDHGWSGERAARRQRFRQLRRVRLAFLFVIVATLVAVGFTELRQLGPTAAATLVQRTPTSSPARTTAAAADTDPAAATTAAPTVSSTSGTPAAGTQLPLSAATIAKLPKGTRQVVVVEGDGATKSTATIRYFERRASWVEVASWSGRVGRSGWARRHVEGDLRTPIGVFTLTDAGGRLANPGTRLTYERSAAYRPPSPAPGFGDNVAQAFDYVIAINYNRVAGRSPLDFTRPMGTSRGGGIWLHVKHDGPTHGCVTLPKSGMKLLLERLDPKKKPVVVMGPRQSL